MAAIRRIGRLFSVIVVVLVGIVAGVFLSACRRAKVDRPSKQPATRPADAAKPKKAPTTRKVVDVDETQKGQPVPRNLME